MRSAATSSCRNRRLNDLERPIEIRRTELFPESTGDIGAAAEKRLVLPSSPNLEEPFGDIRLNTKAITEDAAADREGFARYGVLDT